MCYYKQDKALQQTLEAHYGAVLREYLPYFLDNGFDHNPSPVITNQRPKEFQTLTWGLIPWWVKSRQEALQIRVRTLNCISEEAFEKSSFKDAIRERRCLIPCTGFYEWRWFNNGKNKYPYFVHLKDEALFSLAGIWSEWTDRSTGELFSTYSVLTTKANALMEKIHNSKKRMPVILPQEYEKDWLNPSLTQEDVLALCTPYDTTKMTAYTVSKMITDKKVDNKNVPEVARPFEYPELALLDS